MFRVGITRDFFKPDGSPGFGDIGLDALAQAPGVTWEPLAANHAVLPAAVADRYDALLVLAPRVAAETVAGCTRLAVVARFGVGYDNVDVDACTRNDVLLTITPDGVRRPVATSALALLLAAAHKLLIKDRLTRAGRWHEKLDHMGVGLTGRTLGIVGLGNTGRELARLVAPLEMRVVAADPNVTAAPGVEMLSLEELLRQADFVCVCCALTPATHHLLNADRLALLKPTAYLINVARGPVVDQPALTRLLQERRIAGAALDVFEQEPIDPKDPLLALENVIVAPHAICWTDELFRENGRSACRSILAVAAGRVPEYVVNRDAVESPGLRQKLARFSVAG